MQTQTMPDGRETRIAVIGLGYVGLPLAAAFGRSFPTIGFDVDAARIEALRSGIDHTGEVADLDRSPKLSFANDLADIEDCTIYIVAVPTPIDSNHMPDLGPLITASAMIGQVIGEGDIVIYESTVYPGATEEDCLPVIESVSGLVFNRDFFAGYSPERINPGDASRPIQKILKVTSGSTPAIADFIDALYSAIIEAGTFKASSIKVAEAAKVIENTQRDVNIALINELAIVFSHLGIDTNEVIEAASTKWNFMRLTPGLVGGHCIGVDPYYLLHRSERAGHIPDIIRISRIINDGMARHVVTRLVRAMVTRDIAVKGARILILGATFKENCADIRNTKVIDLVAELRAWDAEVDLHDPRADEAAMRTRHGISLCDVARGSYDAVILAVPHREFAEAGPSWIRSLLRDGGIFFDMKAAFDKTDSDLRL